jgi:uncharacterized protein (TIGR03086 family)
MPIGPGASVLERAVDYALASLYLVTPDLMSRPTPCAGWDLRALLEHVDDAFLTLSEAVVVGRVGLGEPEPATPAPPVPASPADPARGPRAGTPRLSGVGVPRVVSVAGLPLETDIVATVGAVELAVHGWDVAVACGQHRPIPRILAAELLDVVPWFVTAEDRPVRFAEAVSTSSRASPGERLVAYLGRQP